MRVALGGRPHEDVPAAACAAHPEDLDPEAVEPPLQGERERARRPREAHLRGRAPAHAREHQRERGRSRSRARPRRPPPRARPSRRTPSPSPSDPAPRPTRAAPPCPRAAAPPRARARGPGSRSRAAAPPSSRRRRRRDRAAPRTQRTPDPARRTRCAGARARSRPPRAPDPPARRPLRSRRAARRRRHRHRRAAAQAGPGRRLALDPQGNPVAHARRGERRLDQAEGDIVARRIRAAPQEDARPSGGAGALGRVRLRPSLAARGELEPHPASIERLHDHAHAQIDRSAHDAPAVLSGDAGQVAATPGEGDAHRRARGRAPQRASQRSRRGGGSRRRGCSCCPSARARPPGREPAPGTEAERPAAAPGAGAGHRWSARRARSRSVPLGPARFRSVQVLARGLAPRRGLRAGRVEDPVPITLSPAANMSRSARSPPACAPRPPSPGGRARRGGRPGGGPRPPPRRCTRRDRR